MLERAAQELAPFLDEVAFVGGATIALWITDEGAPAPRVTKDVDLVVEVASRAGWYRFEERLRAHGLRNDSSSRVICRWKAGSPGDELVIDLMPGDASILGFENRWQRPALAGAEALSLPSGQRIRAISPPYLLATKLETATTSRTSSGWSTGEPRSSGRLVMPPTISALFYPARSRFSSTSPDFWMRSTALSSGSDEEAQATGIGSRR
jgi:hypothetical protein